jgi:hypothetical protein
MYGDLEVGTRGLVGSKDLDFGFGFLPGISVLSSRPKFEFQTKFDQILNFQRKCKILQIQ